MLSVGEFCFSMKECEFDCYRCKIDWKKGKNLTMKTVKKKQKHKGTYMVVVGW